MLISVVKAMTFGLIAGLVGCYRGLTVAGGAKGVGTAVNETLVLCVIALFAVNVVLTTIGVRFGTGQLTCRPPQFCAPASRGRSPAPSRWPARPAGSSTASGTSPGSSSRPSARSAHALRYYRKEMLRLIAEIGMGTGAMAVIGGTVAIVGFVTLSGSSLVAIQGFASLGNIGVEAFTGFFAALVNVRIAAPVVAGQALAATVGAGATAELGAMRISEEIDALEVMGIKSISYLVSTRIMAGFVVIIPLYAMAIIMSFLSAQVTTTLFYGQSIGTYEHYFRTFLRADDVDVVVRAGDHHLGHRHAQPLLLRLLRQRRAGRRRRGRRPVDAGLADRDRAAWSCSPRWRSTASTRTST